MEEIIEDNILQELEQIYGLGTQAKEILKSYIEYVSLKQAGQISNDGNYNIFIKCPERYDTSKIIELIYKTLKTYNVIDDDNYYELKQLDILHKLSGIKETMIVVADKTNFNMRSTQELLVDFIEQNANKIFIIIYKNERGTRLHRITPIDENLFYWNINVLGKYTKEENQNYIEQKLKHNKLKVSNKCNFINELSKLDTISKIDSELLYIAVKSRANNVHTITDNFLEQIHRPQYVANKKNNEKSAMQELDELIGLEPVKKQIKQIVNYIKVNKQRNQLPMLHMCFLGPAGCGKTEVARIVAKIFQEEEILQNDMVEATRENLVGAYIGHTAIKTRETINKALGATLFIDERLLSYTKFRERLWK